MHTRREKSVGKYLSLTCQQCVTIYVYVFDSINICVSTCRYTCGVVCNRALLYLTNSDKVEDTIPSFKNEYYNDQFALSFFANNVMFRSLLVKKYNDL